MKLHFSKRNKLIFAAAALVLVLLIVYTQFFYLAPLKTDLKTKQQTLQSEQKLLDIATQKKQSTTKTVEDTRELQKEIPIKPMEEQLILDLEKAETLSTSKISSMSFSKGADVNTAAIQANGQNANGQQNTTATQNGTNQTATNQTQANQGSSNQTATNKQTPANQQAQATPTTTGLKKLTVGLSVESPNYEKFETFIQTLESLQRIVVVESITYSGGQEITSLTQTSLPLTYSLTVSAFYMPALEDLASQLPKIDAPAPAGKENPLPQFSDLTTP